MKRNNLKGEEKMSNTNEYKGGENFDLKQMLIRGRELSFYERLDLFDQFINNLKTNGEFNHLRCISSAADREVTLIDPATGKEKKMLMFGSNNYLGLANHPYVKERVKEIINKYGVGLGGPPLLNGYTSLHRELETRLAELKGAEDACIFSSGYGANVGVVTALMNSNDSVLYDAYSHASFCDGIKMSGAHSYSFAHNNLEQLRKRLSIVSNDSSTQKFIGVEGVYSMDGDIAPLIGLIEISKANGSLLIVDDAHGTGMLGNTGRGTAEHIGVEGEIDVTVGTFSKTFATTGGFAASSKSIINYLRFFARSYMFSASLAPTTVATVLAGMDVMERQPELIQNLRDNVRYASTAFKRKNFDVDPESAIIPLRVPEWMSIRKAAHRFYELGIFMNSIEYPAVPLSQQRFRVSLMATHRKEDINKLVDTIEEVWSDPSVKNEYSYENIIAA
jgi:8-amino-7-oxononanoate synthase